MTESFDVVVIGGGTAWGLFTDPEVGHFAKFICDRKGNILGAHVMAANASTMIEEIVLARRRGIRIGALARLVSPHPSMADAMQTAAASMISS